MGAERRLHMAALAAAYQAMSGRMDADTLATLDRVQPACDDAPDLVSAVRTFCVEARTALRLRNIAQLRALGATLRSDIERSLRRTPPGLERRDIHG